MAVQSLALRIEEREERGREKQGAMKLLPLLVTVPCICSSEGITLQEFFHNCDRSFCPINPRLLEKASIVVGT